MFFSTISPTNSVRTCACVFITHECTIRNYQSILTTKRHQKPIPISHTLHDLRLFNNITANGVRLLVFLSMNLPINFRMNKINFFMFLFTLVYLDCVCYFPYWKSNALCFCDFINIVMPAVNVTCHHQFSLSNTNTLTFHISRRDCRTDHSVGLIESFEWTVYGEVSFSIFYVRFTERRLCCLIFIFLSSICSYFNLNWITSVAEPRNQPTNDRVSSVGSLNQWNRFWSFCSRCRYLCLCSCLHFIFACVGDGCYSTHKSSVEWNENWLRHISSFRMSFHVFMFIVVASIRLLSLFSWKFIIFNVVVILIHCFHCFFFKYIYWMQIKRKYLSLPMMMTNKVWLVRFFSSTHNSRRV